MKRTTRIALSALGISIVVVAGTAAAQRSRGRNQSATEAPQATRIIAIPVLEASHMMQQMRVWVFTPPAGSTAFGLGGLGEGRRVWALLPGCHEANPDDSRDPCAVGRVAIELINGTGEIRSTEPQNVVASDSGSRRVQSFVVPVTAEQVRFKILRRDNTSRWEAAVDSGQLHNLPNPEGHPEGSTFAIDLSQYPSR